MSEGKYKEFAIQWNTRIQDTSILYRRVYTIDDVSKWHLVYIVSAYAVREHLTMIIVIDNANVSIIYTTNYKRQMRVFY